MRTIEEGGKVMFVASDVAKMLGYSRPADAVSAHCKGSVKRRLPTNGGMQDLKVIPEGDVYRLITHSKLPSAEKFESWVFDEVLPTIRKYGVFATEELLNNPDFLIKALTELKLAREEKKVLAETCIKQEQVINELKPKADYVDRILQSKSLVPITVIAKDYGMSGREMNEILHQLGIIYKLGKQWLLYEKYQKCGYTASETVEITRSNGMSDVVLHTKWTQKGRMFLYNKLKEIEILPLIEKNIDN